MDSDGGSVPSGGRGAVVDSLPKTQRETCDVLRDLRAAETALFGGTLPPVETWPSRPDEVCVPASSVSHATGIRDRAACEVGIGRSWGPPDQNPRTPVRSELRTGPRHDLLRPARGFRYAPAVTGRRRPTAGHVEPP